MKTLKTILRKKRVIFSLTLLCLIIGLFGGLNSCMQMRTSNKATAKHFNKVGVQHKIITHQPAGYDFTLRTIKTYRSPKKTALIFIHGAPGSSNAFYDYLEDSTLLSKANLYSIDRAGYGYSNFGKSLNSIKEQAKTISDFINNKVTEDSVIVIGHSFGGPIAAYVSLINNKTSHVVMIAPANDPAHEKIFWFSHLGRWKTTKWMLPKPLQVAGDEKFSHVEQLQKIKAIWPQITTPTIHFHGKKDALVPFQNLAFTKELMQADYFKEVIFEEENHFIPWTQKTLVIDELLQILEQ